MAEITGSKLHTHFLDRIEAMSAHDLDSEQGFIDACQWGLEIMPGIMAFDPNDSYCFGFRNAGEFWKQEHVDFDTITPCVLFILGTGGPSDEFIMGVNDRGEYTHIYYNFRHGNSRGSMYAGCGAEYNKILAFVERIYPVDSMAMDLAQDMIDELKGQCPECGGSDYCEACGGLAEIENEDDCHKCEGSGYLDCFTCGGEGDCPDCDMDGDIECTECEGAGLVSVMVECEQCEGSGTCQKCQGL